MEPKENLRIPSSEKVSESFAKKIRRTARLEFGRFAVLKQNDKAYPLEIDPRTQQYRLLASDDEGGLFERNKYGSYSKYVEEHELKEAFEVKYYADFDSLFAPVLSQSEDGTITLTYNDAVVLGPLAFQETARGLYTAQYDPIQGNVAIKRIYRPVEELLFLRSTEPKTVDFFPIKVATTAGVMMDLLIRNQLSLKAANDIWEAIEKDQGHQARSSFA